MGNSDYVLVSVSIDFPSRSKVGALFYCTADDYSRADWDGLRDHGEVIFKLGASTTTAEFCKCVQAGIDVHIPHQKY